MLSAGKAAARKLLHARILLKADASPAGPGWTDEHISEALEVSTGDDWASAPTVCRAQSHRSAGALFTLWTSSTTTRMARQKPI